MTLTEVARVTELSPAVARRCLITLCELGYVGKEDNLFLLRPSVLELSTPFIDSFNIDNIIRPSLLSLRDQTGDSASFAVLAGSDVLYVNHVSTHRAIRLQASSGTRFPALATSLGRAILSALSEGEIDAFVFRYPLTARTRLTITDPVALKRVIMQAKTQGFAVVSDELDYGVTSIACPVVIPGHGIVGALNSSSSTNLVEIDRFTESQAPLLFSIRDHLVEELSNAPELVRALSL
jgi:IclR family transcriptional regulator, pca regulon regulatory protein